MGTEYRRGKSRYCLLQWRRMDTERQAWQVQRVPCYVAWNATQFLKHGVLSYLMRTRVSRVHRIRLLWTDVDLEIKMREDDTTSTQSNCSSRWSDYTKGMQRIIKFSVGKCGQRGYQREQRGSGE